MTGELTTEDREAARLGTHTCKGATAEKGDVKLLSQNDREGAFHSYCIQANLVALWFVALV